MTADGSQVIGRAKPSFLQDGGRGGGGYTVSSLASFPPPEAEETSRPIQTVRLPWKGFIATQRTKVVADAPPLNAGNIVSLQACG